MTASTEPQDLTKIEPHVQERPLRSVKLGWWVATRDGDIESFDEVYMVAHGVDTHSGRAIVEVRLRSHKDPACSIEATGYVDETVRCLKKADAKKIGLVTPEVS